MDKPIISMEHVTKTFNIYKSNRQRFASEILGRNVGDHKTAIRDINLEIMSGERVAILGDAGSGRSTLLNLMAGMTYPTEGTINVRKKTTLIRTLKLGFATDRTGRENIRIQGSVLGWSRREIAEREQAIIDFAELSDIIDNPVSSYPPIQANRLGFAIQTSTGSDIILFDAPFTKKDLAFRTKSVQQLLSICEAGTGTLIMVNNDAGLITELCERGIYLKDGSIEFDGPVEAARKYFKKQRKLRNQEFLDSREEAEDEDRIGREREESGLEE